MRTVCATPYPAHAVKINKRRTYFSAKRSCSRFSAAVKNSSISAADGIFSSSDDGFLLWDSGGVFDGLSIEVWSSESPQISLSGLVSSLLENVKEKVWLV